MASCQEGQAYTERGSADNTTMSNKPTNHADTRMTFSFSALL
jgi:hypothetical protein